VEDLLTWANRWNTEPVVEVLVMLPDAFPAVPPEVRLLRPLLEVRGFTSAAAGDARPARKPTPMESTREEGTRLGSVLPSSPFLKPHSPFSPPPFHPIPPSHPPPYLSTAPEAW
jgi:hypothetical protein